MLISNYNQPNHRHYRHRVAHLEQMRREREIALELERSNANQLAMMDDDHSGLRFYLSEHLSKNLSRSFDKNVWFNCQMLEVLLFGNFLNDILPCLDLIIFSIGILS